MARGILSSTFGTLDFLTPIAEMPLTKVSQIETDGYRRWCDGYQQNWSRYFDPIAVRFSFLPQTIEADLTIMPLIAGTEYGQFISLTSGSRMNPDGGDRHPEALLHLALSINTQSALIKESGNFLGNFNSSLRANPLGWLGQTLAIYADKDAFWDELSKSTNISTFLERNYPKLPLALYCEVKNALGVTGFLASLRAFVEQTAPRMSSWENLEYNDEAYVKVTSREESGAEGLTNLCVYYSVTPKSLFVTLSEAVLKRALDRQKARQNQKGDTKTFAAQMKPWLGTNLCLQVNSEFVPAIEAIFKEQYQSAQQRVCWNNLPILNEWKRLYPGEDPVKLHQQFWNTMLLCPGGGTYVWNEKWHTMESTVYGHPGEPRPGPKNVAALANITGANFGLSFENQGLSVRVVLDRSPKKR